MKQVLSVNDRCRYAPPFAITLLFLFVGCGQIGDGLKKYPAEGTVTINGEPAEGMIVRLISASTSPQGNNAGSPVGVTDKQGLFRLSTNDVADGAVVGDYGVTIVWPADNSPPLRDRLRGKYAAPEKSQLSAKVEAKNNKFAPSN
jgi:hypothetical protein